MFIIIFLIKIKYIIFKVFYRVAVVDNYRNENLSLTKFVRTLLSTPFVYRIPRRFRKIATIITTNVVFRTECARSIPSDK